MTVNCDSCKWNYILNPDPNDDPCLKCNDKTYVNFEPYSEGEKKMNDETHEVNENMRCYILNKANDCVNGKREQDYGTPEDNFSAIADLWSIYKGHPYTAEDVAMMMALLKIARIKSGGGTLDSFIDLAGYAACAGEIWNKRSWVYKNGTTSCNYTGLS